jgi:hypothetical protein
VAERLPVRNAGVGRGAERLGDTLELWVDLGFASDLVGGANTEASTIAPALGRMRRPASSGLLPCTIWKNWVRKKNVAGPAKNIAPKMSTDAVKSPKCDPLLIGRTVGNFADSHEPILAAGDRVSVRYSLRCEQR